MNSPKDHFPALLVEVLPQETKAQIRQRTKVQIKVVIPLRKLEVAMGRKLFSCTI